MRKIILLFVLIHASVQNISVISPEYLRDSFSYSGIEGEVESSVSKFGNLSYLESNIVEVLLPKEENKKGCMPFEKEFETKHVFNFVILLERGECYYWQKVLNAQKAGAFAVIVYHNQEGADVEKSVPSGSDQGNLKRGSAVHPSHSDQKS